jgi:sugar phosphate isomerase/epimerase
VNSHDRGLSIDFISVFGLPPPQFVALASELGCRYVSIALAPMQSNPHDYPPWSLRDDSGLRRDTAAALEHRGVKIALGEGFLVRQGSDIRDAAADMDLMQEMGVPTVNILSLDPELRRGLDQLARFADMAAARGLQATLEFLPGLPIGDLSSAVSALRELAKPNLRLMLDAMHVFRSGSKIADIAALDPNLIGYVQLCDVPWVSQYATYGEEARDERLPPGKGELPLREFLAVLPGNVTIGLEVPMLTQAKAGVGPSQRLAVCVAAARDLLSGSTS